MLDLQDYQSIEMQGSASRPYILKNGCADCSDLGRPSATAHIDRVLVNILTYIRL